MVKTLPVISDNSSSSYLVLLDCAQDDIIQNALARDAARKAAAQGHAPPQEPQES